MRTVALLRVVLFFVGLWLPLYGLVTGQNGVGAEKRIPTPFPPLSPANLPTYPELFDAYFRDNFGFRGDLLHFNSELSVNLLHESPVANVIRGDHGRFFYAGYWDGLDINDFAGKTSVDPAYLDDWIHRTFARRAEYAAKGARYLVVIAPNKQTVYPEDVPARFGPHRPGVLDAFMSRVARTDLDVLDLRAPLVSHKDESLYYATDSHWNDNGAFVAAQAVIDYVRRWFPFVEPLRKSDYDVFHFPRAGGPFAGDLSVMLSMPEGLPDTLWRYARHDPARTRLVMQDPVNDVYERSGAWGRVLVLGDSFSMALTPFLADRFAHVRRYNSSSMGYRADLVTEEHPDLIVLEMVERYLPRIAAH